MKMMEGTAEPTAQAPAPLTGAYGGYAMTLLLLIYLVNFLDRQVVHILAEPIKRDLAIADWQIGLLSGLSFALLYTILGLPIAWLAERKSRPAIIGTSAVVWSGFTLLCGVTQNFGQLVLARVGVGIGEAGCTPAAQSLIMDYAKPEKRSSAFAFYGLGAPLGALAGMAFGGLVADAYGWRAAFLLAGVPGLMLGLLAAFTLREPRRRLARQVAAQGQRGPSVPQIVRTLAARRGFVLWLFALAMIAIPIAAFPPFFGSFYLRNHADELAAMAAAASAAWGVRIESVGLLGLLLGGILGGSGSLGMWCGGKLSDRLGGANMRRNLQGAAIATALGMPLLLGALMVPGLETSLILLGVNGFVWALWYGGAYAAGFSFVPLDMRASASALSLFINNLIGTGLGALAVGLLSDLIGRHMGSAQGVRWSLAAFSLCALASSFLFLRAARHAQA